MTFNLETRIIADVSATCLNSVLGYDDVAAIAKNAHKKGIT